MDSELLTHGRIAGLSLGDRQSVKGMAVYKSLQGVPVSLEVVMEYLRIAGRKNAVPSALSGKWEIVLLANPDKQPIDTGAFGPRYTPCFEERGQSVGTGKQRPQTRTRTCCHLIQDCIRSQQSRGT